MSTATATRVITQEDHHKRINVDGDKSKSVRIEVPRRRERRHDVVRRKVVLVEEKIVVH